MVCGTRATRKPTRTPRSSAGELAQLITGRQRLGGKDVGEIHRLLADLERLELTGGLNRPKDGTAPNTALAIPSTPVERVERRLPDGRWVAQADYEQALEELSDDEALATAQADRDAVVPHAGGGTIRIYLAEWVREQLAGGQSTRLDFRVWAHLRPVGQRLYAWVQATHRDSYDDAIEFYLADPLRYTLGLRGRRHRAAASVRAALGQLYDADVRYNRAEKWSIRGRHANTGIPAFRLSPHRRASAPTDRALSRRKCAAERPAALRGLTMREAREQLSLVRGALQQAAASSPRAGHERYGGLPARTHGAAMSAGP